MKHPATNDGLARGPARFARRACAVFAACLLLPSAGLFAATNTWYGDLDLGPGAALVGDSNDLFRVGGSFNNATTNTAYNLLGATFEFTGSGAHTLEQFSRDRGPCAGNISNNWAFGTLKTAGAVTVVDIFSNSAGPDAVYVQAIVGTGTLNVGSGMKVYYGVTNGWAGSANVTGSGVFRPYLPDNVDSDGDGLLNWQECLCGTDPTNGASALRITQIERASNTVWVTWTTVDGRRYTLQTNAVPNGAGFADYSPPITAPGPGEGATNWPHAGGAALTQRYYRIRLVP
jgi:hypothetical protein